MTHIEPAVRRRSETKFVLLEHLRAYPECDALDTKFSDGGLCPDEDETRVRVWAAIPNAAGDPTLAFDDDCYEPIDQSTGDRRWLDYGVVAIDETMQYNRLAVSGLNAVQCDNAVVLLSSDREYDPEGRTIPAVQRDCWGLARADAGHTELHPSTIEVGEPTQFTVRYTAGQDLPAGALVRFLVPTAFDEPQPDNADDTGFIHVVGDHGVMLETPIERSFESHEHYDVFCRLEAPLKADESFELVYNTEKTYIWPHRFEGASRQFWHSHVPVLTAAVALDKHHPLVWLRDHNGHALAHEAGPAERLNLFLPGRRPADEVPDLTLTGTYTDRFRNAPPGAPVQTTVDLALQPADDRDPITLDGPAGCFDDFHRFEVPLPELDPGVYRAMARDDRDGEVLARSNPLEVIHADREGRDPLYWGVIHVHTEMSDGTGDYADMYRYGRDEGALDFYAGSDHAGTLTENDWAVMQDVTNAFHEPGRFCTLQAWEWAGRCVYTSRDRFDLMTESVHEGLDTLYQRFAGADDVVLGPHDSIGHSLDWSSRSHDPSLQRFGEMYAIWGANDIRDNPFVADDVVFEPTEESYITEEYTGDTMNEILQSGAKLGFTAGGDYHNARGGFSPEAPDRQGSIAHDPFDMHRFRDGLTAMVAPALERPPLISALRERRTYGTTGARILIDFEVSSVPMGEEGIADESRCIVTTHGVAPLEEIRIVKDGDVVHTEAVSGRDATVEWTDPVAPTGEHYYYAMVVQENDQRAWASPVWIREG